MRKLSFQETICNVMLLVVMSLLFINCSSSHDDEIIPSNNASNNAADFSLNITRKQLYGHYLAIDFDVKNISKTSYSVYEQGTFSVKFTAKSTDGEVFQRTTFVDYLEAGVTYSDYAHLTFSANKTLDLSTLTAVIVKD